jgi:hypothetical protein
MVLGTFQGARLRLVTRFLPTPQYMDDAINHLRASGREVLDEHLARLSPLQHEHVLMLGTFPFTLPAELAAGRRRELRTGDRPA